MLMNPRASSSSSLRLAQLLTYTAWIGDRYFGAVEQTLGVNASRQALAEGRAMTLRHAIEHAFEAAGW